MFAYLNDGLVGKGSDQIRLRDWKFGDMAAINDSTFLVIEAGLRGKTDIKKIYEVSLSGASPVSSGLYNGLSLEALDSTALITNNIKTAKKKLFIDLLQNGWPSELDKSEGLAILNDSTVFVSNDNDYGQSSPSENGVATATGKVSHIIQFSLKGVNKIQNYQAGQVVTETSDAVNAVAGLSTFPNPAGNELVISVDAGKPVNATISIVDMNGNNVIDALEKSIEGGSHQISINTSLIKNGIYMVRVITGNRTSTVKAAIVH